jgi:DNA ligase-1
MKSKIAKGLFIPTMQPSYADIHEVIAAHGRTSADLKYDGYRVQVHKQKDRQKVYTRNGNELNYECYPEIIEVVKKLPECLIEAELVGDGKSHKEVFDNVKKRFRRPGNLTKEGFREYVKQNYKI